MIRRFKKIVFAAFLLSLLTAHEACTKLWFDLGVGLLGSSFLYKTYTSKLMVQKPQNMMMGLIAKNSKFSYALGTGLCVYGLWNLGRNFYVSRKKDTLNNLRSHAILEGEEHLSATLEGSSLNYVFYKGELEDMHNLLLGSGNMSLGGALKNLGVSLLLLPSSVEQIKVPKSSTDHLVLLAEQYRDSKVDQDWVKQEEQKTLQVLEEEIMAYVDALPEDLKKLLGDWPVKFAKFKNILASVRTDVDTGLLQKYDGRYAWSDLILAALGLKPCTIEGTKSEQVDLLINLINKKYPEELVSYECTVYRYGPKSRLASTQYALVNTHPLLPLDFVIACYKHDSIDIEVSEQIKSWMADFGKYYKELIASIWVHIDKSTPNEIALLLGLSPEVYDFQLDELWNTGLDHNAILTDNAQAYGLFFASGNISVTLKRTYLILYRMLLSYAYLAINGSKKLCLFLGDRIKPARRSPNDTAFFKKVFGEKFSDVSKKGMLDRALYVLKQAQKKQV